MTVVANGAVSVRSWVDDRRPKYKRKTVDTNGTVAVTIFDHDADSGIYVLIDSILVTNIDTATKLYFGIHIADGVTHKSAWSVS